ncbi:GH3 auxin-responsive promoter-domain-containing protein, partial [Pisolithus tinctorius]
PRRALDVLSYLVKTNSATTYFKESDVLSRFRLAAKELFEVYHNNVALSVYEDYLPFISRFFEQPCKKSSVENLMAPGLPCFIAHSSGTSGGATKHFPKYRHPDHMSMSTSEAMKMSNPTSKSGARTASYSCCLMTSGVIRVSNNMVCCTEQTFLAFPNCSSPLASFLFMHALFALVEPKLETINTLFTTTCRDLCRAIHDQWRFLKPNPDRAGELREIGRATGTPGWFRQIWPELRAILATASGPLPLHYIGPDVSLQTLSIASSEAFLALAYDPTDLNLYKIVGSDDVIEFLPVDEPEESKYLAQTWNVELGKKYEVVLTTRDGFWRYRLGDVPLVSISRWVIIFSMHIRIANEVTTETQLRSVIDTTSGLLGGVSEFCVCTDYRESVGRYAFFVELQGNLGKDSAAAPAALHDELQKLNENYLRDSQSGKIGVPAVRVLNPGTFGLQRVEDQDEQHRCGQVKVPIVVWDDVNRAWLEERVMRDI